MTSDRRASRSTHSGDTPTGVRDLAFSWPPYYRIISLAICKLYMHTARVKRPLTHVTTRRKPKACLAHWQKWQSANAAPTDTSGQRVLVCAAIDLVFRG